jgi:hypothetical protein
VEKPVVERGSGHRPIAYLFLPARGHF